MTLTEAFKRAPRSATSRARQAGFLGFDGDEVERARARERMIRDAQAWYGISREDAEAELVVYQSRYQALI
ncbi:hypothetical protein [Niveibacterium sp. SC-1]|uniref:hypothetical protein n=1 Tax=Niveibacterium sp. SC-1 TaxID=3135646 RepID=UPI00311FB2AB